MNGEPARHLTITLTCEDVPTSDSIIEVHNSCILGYEVCLIADPSKPEEHFECNLDITTEEAMDKIKTWIGTCFSEAFEPELTGRD